MSDTAVVRATLAKLGRFGVRAWLFGGWAEELLGLTSPRSHKDLDLLYPANDFSRLDAFMDTEGVEEIPVKRSDCSRAFVVEHHAVEFYLVREDPDGWYTDFWGYRHRWPADTFSDEGDFPKASIGSLAGLRESFTNVERAFIAHAHQSQERTR
jgi:hypothetical protein